MFIQVLLCCETREADLLLPAKSVYFPTHSITYSHKKRQEGRYQIENKSGDSSFLIFPLVACGLSIRVVHSEFRVWRTHTFSFFPFICDPFAFTTRLWWAQCISRQHKCMERGQPLSVSGPEIPICNELDVVLTNTLRWGADGAGGAIGACCGYHGVILG